MRLRARHRQEVEAEATDLLALLVPSGGSRVVVSDPTLVDRPRCERDGHGGIELGAGRDAILGEPFQRARHRRPRPGSAS